MALTKEVATGEEEFHGILIVGGGICGLATALALHRKGINSLVLEKADSLRATGASISLKANGWRALDQFKVSEELRKLAVPLNRRDVKSIYSDKVINIPYRCEGRCVKRSDLVETLARHLPGGCIRFACKVEAISLDPITHHPIVSTSNGSTIRAKVLIGCDGANSVVAKFLGLKPVRFMPLWAARGLTNAPGGHNFRDIFLELVGEGMTFRLIPMNERTVYFTAIQSQLPEGCANSWDPALIQKVVLQAMQGYPEDVLDHVVRNCEIESVSLAHICYRAPWDMVLHPFREGTVTVAGDAMHTMGPFIGAGGSASLEDALVLARCLADTAMGDDSKPARSVEEVLRSYVNQRRWRILRLTVQSYLNGQLDHDRVFKSEEDGAQGRPEGVLQREL